MLDFHKERNVPILKKQKETILKKYVRIFGNSQQFCHRCVYGRYCSLKLGQNMELGTGTAHILGPLMLGRSILYIEWAPGTREV